MNKQLPGYMRADDIPNERTDGFRADERRLVNGEDVQRSESELVASLSSGQPQMKRFKITIGGESYFLVSDEPEERVKAVARLVDGQMRAIMQAGHSDDPKRVAVLVALQCASKMLAHAELIEKCQAYNDKLLGLIAEEMTKFYDSSEHSLLTE